MWRYFLPAAAFIALGGLFAFALVRIGQGSLDIREIKSPLLGKPAPGFRLPTLAEPGRVVASSAFAGRPYLVNVWGTWCAECRAEHSALLAIGRTSGLPIVGLDWKDDRQEAIAYLRELGNPYAETLSDNDGRTAIDWGVYGAPETFLVSADGHVLEKHIGALSLAIWQKKFAPRLAGGGAP